MKKSLLTLMVLMVASALSAHAQLITGFGTSELNPTNLATDLTGQWANVGVGSQTATTLTITGATNIFDASSGVFSALDTPESIVGNTGHLSLTGTLNSPVPQNDKFSITLYDSVGDSLGYNFNWSAFSGGDTVVASLASTTGVFNGTVSYWGINLFGSAGDSPSTIGFTFDSLMAVAAPEPSTYALMGVGLGLLGFGVYRRQKTSVAVRI